MDLHMDVDIAINMNSNKLADVSITFNIHLISTIILYEWRWTFCVCCLLGRKIGSLVTQPQPTIDWHHFLQNYHVLVFVVISFDDSENPHNQLANSFDFTGFSQEMSTSQVVRVRRICSNRSGACFLPRPGNSDEATKGFVQSDPFETTARWRKKNPPQNCPRIWEEILLILFGVFFWHDHIIHVSFQWQKPPNFLFGHWTSSQNCCVDTCGNLSRSKHRRFGMSLSVVSMFVAHPVDGRNYAMDGH